MTDNRLQRLHDAGQSIWLDFIDRTMLRNGDLARRISTDLLTGMTSNPTIFEKALAEGSAYDEQIGSAPAGLSAPALFELLATTDVREACDGFAGVFKATNGADGYACRFSRSLLVPREQCRRHNRGSAASLEDGGSPQCDDQGARY